MKWGGLDEDGNWTGLVMEAVKKVTEYNTLLFDFDHFLSEYCTTPLFPPGTWHLLGAP